MTISSILNNLAAINAQQSIGAATQAVQNETTALSSGNRLVNASTDVAALSTGTALQSQVNSLTTALTIAAQGSSLLQVADGALAQIQSIIERQQAIASSAQSGSLSDTQRGFLDQEFQNLTQQIDQLATATNFNGVDLLSGGIAGGVNIGTNSTNGNTSSPIVSSALFTVASDGATNPFSSADTITVNGFTLALGASSTAGVNSLTGNTVSITASNIAAALNASGAPQLANYHFVANSGGAGQVQAIYTGQAVPSGAIPSITVSTNFSAGITSAANATFAQGTLVTTLGANLLSGGTGDTNVLTVNGVSITEGTQFSAGPTGSTIATVAANLAAYLNSTQNAAWAGITFSSDGTDGKLYAAYTGTTNTLVNIVDATTAGNITALTNVALNTQGVLGLSAGGTSAVGTINGSGLFVNDVQSTDTGTTSYGSAVDLSSVANNASFIGSFGGTGTIGAITANYINNGTGGAVTFSVVVGNDTYTTGQITNATLTGTSPTALTFTGTNTVAGTAEGGSFTLNLAAAQATVTSQDSANQLASALNSGLSTVSAYENRNVLSFNNNFSAEVGSTETGTLSGATVSMNSNNFSNTLVSSISVAAPGTGQTDAKIQMVIGGQTYSTVAGIGDTLATSSVLTLENLANPSQTITLTFGSTTDGTTSQAVNLSTSSDAAAFQTALENAFGLTSAHAALSFQVGSTSADAIGVSIGSATTSSLFGGQSLDVKSIADALTASTQLTTALNTVTALRAGVGALEERFNFATNAATSAQQNEGAAVSNLLDTDVASASTQFATSQVQLQAGIAVLAQANQLQQNLLKLIQ